MAAPPPKKTGGLSLYANLLGQPNDNKQPGATISSAPVRYDNKKEVADEQKRKDAALQFQPVRRPQGNTIKRPVAKKAGGAGHAFSSSISTTGAPSVGNTASSPDKQPVPTTSTPAIQRTSNFEDWVGDEDDDAFYLDQQQANKAKHERGGKKKRNKKAKGGQGGLGGEERRTWSWDDIYDPSLPNTFAEYRGSEEQVGEIREWKGRLYFHRMKRARKSNTPVEVQKRAVTTNSMFAPPASLSFAPPTFDDFPPKPAAPVDDDEDDYYPPPPVPSRQSNTSDPSSVPSRHPDTSDSYEPPVSFSQPASVPDDEDPYLRRMRLSGASPSTAMPPPPMPMPMPMPPADPRLAPPPPPPPAPTPVMDEKAKADIEAKRAEAAAKIAAFKAKVEAAKAAKAAKAAPPTPVDDAPPPPPSFESAMDDAQLAPEAEAVQVADEPGATISRAPVRYQLPAAPAVAADIDDEEQDVAEESRSNRPGQKGFAERLLKKYGWEKGAGLGAKGNEGITTAIVAKAEKRKKLADAQGGGWKTPGNMGKLVGGKRRKVAGDTSTSTSTADADGEGKEVDEPFGELSSVIKLSNMLTGLDVDDEIQNKDLYGEIGREFEREYGKVERVFIWREAMGGRDEVFVKFVSPLSALRAVGACEGMEFAGNVVQVRFWPEEKFGDGVYG